MRQKVHLTTASAVAINAANLSNRIKAQFVEISSATGLTRQTDRPVLERLSLLSVMVRPNALLQFHPHVMLAGPNIFWRPHAQRRAMLLQMATYRIDAAQRETLRETLQKLRELYLRLGCSQYEVYHDKSDPSRIIELAFFRDKDALSVFETDQSAEKTSLFANFCCQLSLSASDVIVTTLEQESLQGADK